MGELRDVAGLPLRRIYRLFPSRDELIVAILRRQHERMMVAIEDRVAAPTLRRSECWRPSPISTVGFRALETRAVLDAGYSPEIADVIYLWVAGSVTTAGIQHSLDAAIEARRGVQMLLAGARAEVATGSS